jgi:hypothetical protein
MGISYQIVNSSHETAFNLSHCVDMEKGSGNGRDTDAHNNSYPSGKRKRRKRGRPCKAWHLRPKYLRRFSEKRLRPQEVANLIDADRFATRTRRRLETFVTIRWAHTVMGEIHIHARWLKLLNAFRIWASRHGLELAHCWAHENPPRHEPAFNSHMLANIPPALRPVLASWLAAQIGARDGAIRIEPRTSADWRKPDARIAYMVKGTDWATARKHRLVSEKGWDFQQGVIPFKRCGTSANLSPRIRDQYARARDGMAA